MHEMHIFKNMMRYFKEEEKLSLRSIKKIYVNISEFGGIKGDHFLEHCREAFAGTKWETLEIDIRKVPYGSDFEITGLEFV